MTDCNTLAVTVPKGHLAQAVPVGNAPPLAQVRFVDLWNHGKDDCWGDLIVDGDQGYDVISLTEEPTPATRQRWPQALRVPRAGATQVDTSLDWLPLGDTATVTWRRLDLAVTIDGDRINRVHACPGRLASDVSDLARRHAYTRLPVLAESLNEQAPASMALATVLAIEALCDIEPPLACQYARVVVAELGRVQAHLGWLVVQATACAEEALVAEARQCREALAQLFVDLCGRRRPTGIHHPGRILIDLSAARSGWSATQICAERLIVRATRALIDRRSWRRRLGGVGHLDATAARGGLATGPVARASGVNFDVRQSHPYLTYSQLDVAVAVAESGDVVARSHVRLQEMQQSLTLVTRALATAQGPLAIDDPRIAPPPTPLEATTMMHHFALWMEGHGLRPPPGRTVFVGTEAPEGEFGVLLCSDGSGKPRRVHWRSPSSYHFRILPDLLRDQRFSDAADVIASLNVNAVEIDR